MSATSLPWACAARLMAAMLLGVACGAAAQGYPARPLRLVLGFLPGGTANGAARQLAEQLATHVEQPVIVENRPGASGNIAAANVARSPAHGYTPFFGTNTTHAANATLYPKLDFHPVKHSKAMARPGAIKRGPWCESRPP